MLKSALLGFMLFLSACSNIRPLYDDDYRAKGAGKIEIDVIAERDGQKLRTYLQDKLEDMALPFEKKHILSIKLESSEKQFAFTKDGNASREIFSYSADVALKNSERQTVWQREISVSTEYNVSHTQGSITLSLYGRNNDALIRELGDKIIENLRMYQEIEN